jgi:transcriptional antiterminator RfaH
LGARNKFKFKQSEKNALKAIIIIMTKVPTKSVITFNNQLHATTPRWFAVRLKFKSEKMVLKMLELKQIHCYLPLKQVVRVWSKKRRETEMPLIPSFIFVKIVASEYVKVLETEYVSTFLKFGKNLLCIPEQQIDWIRRLLLEEDIELVAHEKANAYIAGDEVEVIAGGLMGMRGRLVKVQGKDRVLVEIDNSGYVLQMNIDTQFLKKLAVQPA